MNVGANPPAGLSSNKPLLLVDQISRDFGGLLAVDRVSFKVSAGEVVGLTGPNGSGKTTLLNLISAIYPPSSGDIFLMGRKTLGLSLSEVASLGLARTFQSPRLFNGLTCEEHILVGLANRRGEPKGRSLLHDCKGRLPVGDAEVEAILYRLGLLADRNRLAAGLSYGKRRHLEIARCLAAQPQLLLLDEPTAGLNDDETEDLSLTLRKLSLERGCAFLVIEHKIDFLRSLCPRQLVMVQGRLLADGPASEVFSRPEVAEAYFGAPL